MSIGMTTEVKASTISRDERTARSVCVMVCAGVCAQFYSLMKMCAELVRKREHYRVYFGLGVDIDSLVPTISQC